MHTHNGAELCMSAVMKKLVESARWETKRAHVGFAYRCDRTARTDFWPLSERIANRSLCFSETFSLHVILRARSTKERFFCALWQRVEGIQR